MNDLPIGKSTIVIPDTRHAPINYGVCYCLASNQNWLFQIALSTAHDTFFVRRNINQEGWSDNWQQSALKSDLTDKVEKQHTVTESYQSYFDKYTGGGNVVFAVVTYGYNCGFYALYEHGNVYPVKLLCGDDMSEYGIFTQNNGYWTFTSKTNWTAVKFFY